MFVTLLLLFGFSSFNSGSGTFNLYSARTLPFATLNFNVSPGGAIQEYGSYKHVFANSKFGFTYGVIDPLEIYIGTTIYGKYAYSNSFFSPDDVENEFGWQNLYGGIKFYIPLTGSMEEGEQSFKWLVGGHIGTSFNPFSPSNKTEIIGLPHIFYPTYKYNPDLALDLLNDFEIYPLLVHVNLGYVLKGDTKETGGLPGFSRPNVIRIGGGLEIAAGPFTRFIFEVKDIRPEDNLQDTLTGTFGIRFVVPKKFSFDIAVDHVFNDSTDFIPDPLFDESGQWRYKIGFTLQSTILEKKKEEEPKKGTIVLTVNDLNTNEPLVAAVNFKDSPLSYETGEDGKVTIEILPGIYNLELSKEGYLPREAAITVKPSSTLNINTVLRKAEKETGVLSGTVSSFREEIPLQATIEFLGTKLGNVISDPLKGIFQEEVQAGTYNIRVSAEDYLPETFPVEITQGKTTIKNVKLVKKLKKEEKIVLRGINFATGQSIIPPSEYPVLDQVVQVLKANEKVRVEVGGHTDAVGGDTYNQGLSERRAQSVRNYLIQRGIDAMRLDARGYGEYQPVASNTTRDGRSQNRRIEFRVLSVE